MKGQQSKTEPSRQAREVRNLLRIGIQEGKDQIEMLKAATVFPEDTKAK